MRKFRPTFLMILWVLIMCSVVRADRIVLKNGDRLTGSIVKSDLKELVIKTEFAGEVKVQWDAITELNSDQPIYLTLKDEQVVVGSVTTSGENFVVRTETTGNVNVARANLASVRNKAEYDAWKTEIERLRDPGLLDLWSGSVDLGYTLGRGTSDTDAASFGFTATRATPRDKISAYAAALYAKTKDGKTGVKTTAANAIRGGLRYDLNLTKKVFVYGFGDLEHDEVQSLDLRFVLGGGAGYHVIQNERTLFDLFGGANVNKEYFFNNINRTSTELTIGEELVHKLSERTQIKERLIFFPNMSEGGEYRIAFDASAVTALSRWLSWQITLSDRYISNPPPGATSNNLILSTGIRLTFAR